MGCRERPRPARRQIPAGQGAEARLDGDLSVDVAGTYPPLRHHDLRRAAVGDLRDLEARALLDQDHREVAAAAHAIILGVFMLALAPLVEQIPLPALAGVLIATASHMVKPSELKHTFGLSKLDALVLAATLIVTVFFNLTAAVVVGLVLFLGLRGTRLSKVNSPIDYEETLGD